MSLGEHAPPLHVGKINYHKNLTPELAIIRVQPAYGDLCLTLKLVNSWHLG
jgi:hypothetical protein